MGAPYTPPGKDPTGYPGNIPDPGQPSEAPKFPLEDEEKPLDQPDAEDL